MSVAQQYMTDYLNTYGWSQTKKSLLNHRYEEQHEVPNIKKVPMMQFVSEGIVVESSKPVELVVTFEDEQYIATNETLNIFAAGESISSVVSNFSHHIVHFYEYYLNKDINEVTGNGLRLKKIYENFKKLTIE